MSHATDLGTAGTASAGVLMGYSCSAVAAATVVIRNGTSSADPAVAYVAIPAGGCVSAHLPAVDCRSGIFVDRATGTANVALYLL